MISFSRKQRYLLSILSGILMVLSFPYTGSLALVAFLAWIPLLLVEAHVAKQNYRSGKVFIHAYITFFIYNIGTTWWVWNASPEGSVMAFFLNSLLMTVVFYMFHLTKKNVGSKEGYISLVIYWIAFEHFHYDWESSWPWLSLGNVFGITPSWVQWYSVTGVQGGTLWVLIINLVLFRAYQNVLIRGEKWRIQTPLFYSAIFLFVVPITTSLIMYFNYEEKKNPLEVVVVQPNIDPYTKFDSDPLSQLQKMVEITEPMVTSRTELVVAPETAVSEYLNESAIRRSQSYSILVDAKMRFNDATLLWGAATYNRFDRKRYHTSYEIGKGLYEEVYNTTLMIDSINAPKLIHKTKMVPGVETIPFMKYFPFMADWSIDMGGSSQSLTAEEQPKIFTTKRLKIAPVICYESAFGGFVAEQCNQGAQLICVITNDGWWKDTPGYKQHASFARLRAIENRRSVVRSANTGKSCIIDQRGDMLQETDWWVQDVIRADVNLNNELSIYTMYGDVLGRSFSFVSIFLLLFTFVKRFKRLVSK